MKFSMVSIHTELMDYIGTEEGLTSLASKYHGWICNESATRLKIITRFTDGTHILTKAGLDSCMDALIGIAHLNFLADLVVKKYGETIPLIAQETAKILEADYVKATKTCRALDMFVTLIFDKKESALTA